MCGRFFFSSVAILSLQSAGMSSGTKQFWAPRTVGYFQKSLEASRHGKQAYLLRISRISDCPRPPKFLGPTPWTSCLQNSKWRLKDNHPPDDIVSINLHLFITI